METEKLNSHMFISATLLFVKEEKKVFKASRFSKVFNISTYEHLLDEIQKISMKVVDSHYVGYKFLGVNDLFVSDEEGNGRFLGRTSIYDCKTVEDSEELILSDLEINDAVKKIKEFQKVNLGFGYFHKDENDDENNFALIVYSQITKYKDLESIISLAKSRSFKEQIVRFSVDYLQLQRLRFIGITDFYGIQGPGFFEEYAEFKTLDEILPEIYSNVDLKNKFREVAMNKDDNVSG